ncbi:MAG: polysaccharide lyase family 7 protein [Gammaproteobacteria bacterium]|nr:polysaccharide lyase family 7 protein [Gammaproteobacteria bacterium]
MIADRINLSNSAQTGSYIKLQLNGDENNQASGIIEFEAFGCNQEAAHNIELIDWYLSVQTDEDNNGKSDSIKETALADGYFDPRFFYPSADSGLVFTSSVKGYKTSTNTKYVRSELREMLRRGNSNHKTQGVNKNNWVFSSAPSADLSKAGGIDGILDVEVAVNSVTTTGEDYQVGRVIIGQIHANDDEPVRLYYRKLPNNSNGSIYIAHELLEGDDTYYELIGSRSNNASNPSDGIPLNEKFSYQIKVVGNQLTVTVTKNDNQTYTQVVDMSNSRYDEGGQYMYFKAGVYNQNNSGDLHDYVQATFYKIDNAHEQYEF